MAPKIDAMEALHTLAGQETPGVMTERGEFVMDQAMGNVITALTAELGGLGARSKVVRRLILKGARAELAERQARETQTEAQKALGALDITDAGVVLGVEAAKELERAKRRERDRRRKERLAQEGAQA